MESSDYLPFRVGTNVLNGTYIYIPPSSNILSMFSLRYYFLVNKKNQSTPRDGQVYTSEKLKVCRFIVVWFSSPLHYCVLHVFLFFEKLKNKKISCFKHAMSSIMAFCNVENFVCRRRFYFNFQQKAANFQSDHTITCKLLFRFY